MLRSAILGLVFTLLLTACGGNASPKAPAVADANAPALPVVVEAPATAPAPPAPTPTPQPARTRRLVVLDPGHGGDEVGAARNGVVEKTSNLDFALRVEALLVARGVDVLLTRRDDTRAAATVPGFTATRSDLQARIDAANAARGDVFVSIHSNGSEDLGQNGVEAWYDSSRADGEEGKRLAGLLTGNVLRELDTYGFRAQNRGLFDGRCFRQREGRCFTLFVISGAREISREEIIRRGGQPEDVGFSATDQTIYSKPLVMPAALVELLIITNARDAAVLRDEAGRQAIARGVAAAILAYLGVTSPGS